MEGFPNKPRVLENQKPEKRKKKKEHDPERRKFLKDALIAGAVAAVGTAAIKKGWDYLDASEKEQAEKESVDQRQLKNDTVDVTKIEETDKKKIQKIRKFEVTVEKNENPNQEKFHNKRGEEQISNRTISKDQEVNGDDGKTFEQEAKSNAKVEGNGKVAVLKDIKRRYGGRIRIAAVESKIKPEILTALIVVESSGNERAVSPVNAMGLTQLMPGTAKLVGVRDPYNPYENIVGGARYLRMMLDQFGDMHTALAAYNMGPGRLNEKIEQGYDPKENDYANKVLDLAGLM